MSSPELLRSWLRQAFIRLVADQTGLKIRDNDQESFGEIIIKRTQGAGLLFPENYYELLDSETDKSRKEWTILISELTNSETFFFRDKGQISLLKHSILPTLLAQKQSSKTLRICSAGCSTGEEPYSIAMLLRELVPDLDPWDLTVLGVDINSASVNKARAGVYRAWSLRGVDKNIKRRFFQEKDGQYHVNKAIRDMVRFQTVNLLNNSFSDPSFDIKDMDLIICRNVFIYFGDAAIKTVLDKFYNALQPSGYLLVGHAELHSQNPTQFQMKVFEESIAYQRPSDRHIAADILMQSFPAESLPDSDFSEAAKLRNFENLFAGHDSKMQEVALNLLRQLPADAKISRLGNRTASELILQIQAKLQETD